MNPTMHCQAELNRDLGYKGFLPDHLLMQWFHDRYSTSKHLLTLYSIARGLSARQIVEIGFGRSSFVLARVAAENQGRFIACDMRDFSYLLNAEETSVTQFIVGQSDRVWQQLPPESVDLFFLDYFSDGSIGRRFVRREIDKAIRCLRPNGVVVVHDSIVAEYSLHRVLRSMQRPWSRLLGRPLVEIASLPYNYGLAVIRCLPSFNSPAPADAWLKKDDKTSV